MKAFEMNDWMQLNSIIYKIYTMEDVDEMRLQLLEQLGMLLDFDSADFFLAARDGADRLTRPVLYHCDDDLAEMYDSIDYSRGILYSGKTVVYRETNIISDEARTQTEYYQKVYRPNHWHYSMQLVMAYKKKFVGVITFYRTIGKKNFKYDDIFILDLLKDHLSYRLYQEYTKGSAPARISPDEAVEKFHLTRRESDVLREMLEGKETHETAQDLNISENTLKKHILNIYRKAGVNTRIQLLSLIG